MTFTRLALSPTLVLVVAAAAAAAERPTDVDRAVRVQEASQRSIAGSTTATVKDIAELAEEIRCNQIGDPAEIAALQATAEALAGLTDSAAEKTMPWVQARLSIARGEQTVAELNKASEAQTGLVKSLDSVVEKLKRPAPMNAMEAIKQAMEKQEKAKEDTEKLAEQTLGKEKQDLTASEKAETERIAERQQKVEQAITDAVKQLREQARSETSAQKKQDLQKAADQLEQSQAKDQARQAQQDIADNQLSQATEKQQRVLDALENAAKAASMQPTAPKPLTAQQLQQLRERLDQLAKLERRQQDALKAAKQLNQQTPPQAASQLQKTQREIAKDLEQAQQQNAAKPANRAADQLPLSPEEARKAMEEALAALEKAKKDLQQQLDESQKPPMPEPTDLAGQKSDPDAKPLGKLEDGEKNAKRNGQWQVQLQPQEREVLATGAGEKFPERYEQALTDYYRALANGGSEP